MKLVKFKVGKFRSVKGTDWVDLDNLTCLVGTNEAGKTNLLLPLWKFNPADSSIKIDLLHDYPRDEYSLLNKERESENFISTLFSLSENERLELQDEYGSIEKEIEEESGSTTVKELLFTFTDHLLVEKNYQGDFSFYLSNLAGEKLSKSLNTILPKDWQDGLITYLPKFVYYSEYGNLDSDLYLPRVKDDMKRFASLSSKDQMKVRTLRVLFSHLNLNPDEILSLGQELPPTHPNGTPKSEREIDTESRKKLERYAKVTSAATYLTNQFRSWWRQGDYTFHFNADGQYFRILVSDSMRPSPIELEFRSKGLQWFFSFFLVFLAESENEHSECILLLDEPGLNLHPNAQLDLINFFESLSVRNQLIYTTHLPFLVDHNNLDRVKAVFSENGLTKISNDLNKADKERKAIQPVNAAIGISASQSLLSACQIVIVEGVSDQFYLSMIRNFLISKGEFTPKNEIVFLPVGGAKGVKPVVSIVSGTTEDLPFVVLDCDQQGSQMCDNLKAGLYASDKGKIVSIDKFTKLVGSEIEDLIPKDLVIDAFDRVFRPSDRLEMTSIDSKKSIIPQLESFAKSVNFELPAGWKVDLARYIKTRFRDCSDKSLVSKWKDLFQSFSA